MKDWQFCDEFRGGRTDREAAEPVLEGEVRVLHKETYSTVKVSHSQI